MSPRPSSQPDPGTPLRLWLVEQAVLALLGAGASVAPVSGWIIRTLGTLCHEVGHAVAAWTWGRPAVPAFDFSHGGGMTMTRERSSLLVVLVLVAWVWALVQLWPRRQFFLIGCAAAALWAGVLATQADESIGIAMGHGGTLVFAAIFLARGLTGDGTAHQAERWLSAVVGWALAWQELLFAHAVLHDVEVRGFYLDGKAGIDNDFVRLAETWGWSLDTLLWLHLLLALPLVTGGALLWWQGRGRQVPPPGC